MPTITVSFKDAFGISHTDAIVAIGYGYKNVSVTEAIGENPQSNTDMSVRCQFKYWTSLAAKNEGAQPMVLTDLQGATTFVMVPASVEEISNLETYCLNQLTATILPTIDPNAAVVA